MSFDIENFPTSEAALKMLDMVTKDFYTFSYVMKWLYQIQGLEMDEVQKILDELREQAYPETATWGLMYHEIKWGLPVRKNLSNEERRILIQEKRDARQPITPYIMEKRIREATGYEIRVADVNDSGPYGWAAVWYLNGEHRLDGRVNLMGHPNAFKVYLISDGTLPQIDLDLVRSMIKKMKQTQTVYTMNQRTILSCCTKEEVSLLRVNLRFVIDMWYCVHIDGSWILDGSQMLNSRMGYDLVPAIKYSQGTINELMYWSNIFMTLKVPYVLESNEEVGTDSLGIKARIPIDGAGAVLMDGHRCLDGTWDLSHKQKNHIDMATDIRTGIENEEQVTAVLEKKRNVWRLNGTAYLRDERQLNAYYTKEEL